MFRELELGPRQRAAVAAAMTLGSVLILVLVVSTIVWGLAAFAATFKHVLLPPVVAGILAMLFRPYFTWLQKTCRQSGLAALALFFLSVLVPLAALLWYAGAFAIHQFLLLLDALPPMITAIKEMADSYWPQITALQEKHGVLAHTESLLDNPGELATRALQSIGTRLFRSIAQMFQSAAGLFAWAVTPVYLAFFLMAKPFEAKQMGEYLPFLKKETREDVVYLLDQFIIILLTFFRGQILIALAQGVLFAIGFILVGLPYGMVIGMTLGILNVIPYLGSIAGLAIALPLAYFGEGGSVLRTLLVLAVFSIVQAIESYVLTPRIMGDRTGLHPALIIFAIFFWGVALGGILGMMLAIPLTAFAVVFWRLLKKKYITEVV